ncbi:hypothetical protein BKA93DRAFT_879089 [Sparassis latifolia]
MEIAAVHEIEDIQVHRQHRGPSQILLYTTFKIPHPFDRELQLLLLTAYCFRSAYSVHLVSSCLAHSVDARSNDTRREMMDGALSLRGLAARAAGVGTCSDAGGCGRALDVGRGLLGLLGRWIAHHGKLRSWRWWYRRIGVWLGWDLLRHHVRTPRAAADELESKSSPAHLHGRDRKWYYSEWAMATFEEQTATTPQFMPSRQGTTQQSDMRKYISTLAAGSSNPTLSQNGRKHSNCTCTDLTVREQSFWSVDIEPGGREAGGGGGGGGYLEEVPTTGVGGWRTSRPAPAVVHIRDEPRMQRCETTWGNTVGGHVRIPTATSLRKPDRPGSYDGLEPPSAKSTTSSRATSDVRAQRGSQGLCSAQSGPEQRHVAHLLDPT